MSSQIEQIKSTVRTKQRRAKALEKTLMRDFVSDVEELVKKVVDIPGVDLATVRDRVSGAIADARGAIEGAVENGANSVRSGARVGTATANRYVRGYPWAAVGVAIGIGVLLGFSSRR